MLKKCVGRNSLNVYLSFWWVPSESIFSFTGWRNFIYIYIALAWRHRTFLSKILSAFFIRSLGTRFNPSVHGDISLQNWFSYSLFPLDEKGYYFRFMILSNHLASFFFPAVTECKHLLAFILSAIRSDYDLFHPRKVTEYREPDPHSLLSPTGRPKLTNILYFSFNGQSLAAY